MSLGKRVSKTPRKNELTGYKITDVNRTKKFGIACRNYEELKSKACFKLNINYNPANVNVFLLDGSLIDEEYFHTLQAQTTLIVQAPGEKVPSDADILYETLRRVNIDFLNAGDKASQFLTENFKAKVATLNRVLSKDDTWTLFSTRDEHPAWFDGLNTNAITKEAYMHRRCQDRIRGYLYKAIEQIRSSEIYNENEVARKRLIQIINFFKLQLKQDHYFGYYFDRSRNSLTTSNDQVDSPIDDNNYTCYDHCPCKMNQIEYEYACSSWYNTDEINGDETDAKKFSPNNISMKSPLKLRTFESKNERVALCDLKGEFKCMGVWNANECSYEGKHTINPYTSKEELILFSTWNLDHRVERSRTLIPNLLKMLASDGIEEKDVIECYENLFTLKNLRLVHVVCHDKGVDWKFGNPTLLKYVTEMLFKVSEKWIKLNQTIVKYVDLFSLNINST